MSFTPRFGAVWRGVRPLLVLAALCLVPSEARAGAWVRGAGEAYLQLGASYFGSRAGTAARRETLDSWEAALYGEVGLGSRLQLVATVPYKVSRSTVRDLDLDLTTRSFGDVRLQIDVAALRGPVRLTPGVEVTVAPYEAVDAAGTDVDGDTLRARVPANGEGVEAVTPRLQLGAALGRRGWLAPDVGVRIRLGGHAPAVVARLGAGAWLAPHMALGGHATADLTFGGSDDDPSARSWANATVQVIVGRWQTAAAPDVVLGAGYTLAIRNSGPGYGGSLALAWEIGP